MHAGWERGLGPLQRHVGEPFTPIMPLRPKGLGSLAGVLRLQGLRWHYQYFTSSRDFSQMHFLLLLLCFGEPGMDTTNTTGFAQPINESFVAHSSFVPGSI